MDSCLRHGQDRKIRGVWRWWVWRWLRSCLLAMFAVSSFKFGTCWTVGLGECFSMETEKLLLGIVSINICYENQLMFLSECSQKLFARHACSFKCECFWRVEISWADGFIFRTECWILLDLHYLHLFTPFDLAAPATARMWRMCLSTCGRQFRSTWLRQDLAGLTDLRAVQWAAAVGWKLMRAAIVEFSHVCWNTMKFGELAWIVMALLAALRTVWRTFRYISTRQHSTSNQVIVARCCKSQGSDF